MSASIADLARSALNDVERVVEKLNAAAFDSFIHAIVSARVIALHGLGREGQQMNGFAMRLFHLGLDAHVVGEMTTPPVGKGDLLICSAGPGDFATIAALMKIAKDAGAKTAVVTAQPTSKLAKSATHVLHIPAQTMADDQGASTSVLPMGSLFELSQMLVFELLVLRLREIKGESAAAMRARHTNLE
ncbi:MAG TPA: 6-phospho-3-hexuloisomerase [Dongiaceae bacterium]|nr:6-phospho-3-hexuloisomerase [Dongiaceae bacterium]